VGMTAGSPVAGAGRAHGGHDALRETIAVLSDPDLVAAHAAGRRALAADDYLDGEELATAMREAGRPPASA